MKYLKKFENKFSQKGKLYQKGENGVSHHDAIRIDEPKYGHEKIIELSDNDILRIKKALNKQKPGLKIEREDVFNTLAVRTCITDVESQFCLFSIYKTADEYFYVTSGGDSYKCDQIVGVLELINDIDIKDTIEEWLYERTNRRSDGYAGTGIDYYDEDDEDRYNYDDIYESLSNQYYRESDESVFRGIVKSDKQVPFDSNDYKVIKNVFNKLPGGRNIDLYDRISYQVDTYRQIETQTRYSGVRLSKHPQDDREGIIHIQSFKSEDEYFYTKIQYELKISYYVCDQLYGLVEFIKDCDRLV